MWWTDIRIQTYFTVLCGVIGLIKISQLSLSEKLILWIVWQNALVDLFGTYLAFHKIYNAWLYNFHLPIQYSLTLLFYSTLLRKNNRIIIYTGIAVITVFSILNSIYIQQNSLHTYTIFLSGSIIAVSSYLLLRNYVISENNLFTRLAFWFTAANFAYFVISIHALNSMPLANVISPETAKELLTINYFAYILWSIIIAIGFLCKRTNQNMSYLL